MTQFAREFSDFQIVSTLSAQLPWLAFPKVLWILAALRNFWEAFRSFGRCFWEMLTLSQGTEELWAVIFLPVAAFRAVFFARRGVLNCALCNGGTSLLAFVAFDAGNTLLFSGVCKTRYQKGPPTVRNMRAVLKKASYGTRRVFRSPPCSKQASVVRKEYSVPETPSYGTRHIFRGAKQPTPQTVNSLLLHRTHFQRRRTAFCCTECTFGCPAVLKPFHNSIQNGNH